jgi:thiol-disulfide isomerase/thioredoxin
MSKRTLTLTGFIVGIPIVLALAWWLISPVFINRTVDEPFPATTGGTMNDEVAIPAEENAMMEDPTTGEMAEDDDTAMEDPVDGEMTAGDEVMEEKPAEVEMTEDDDAMIEEPTDGEMVEGDDSVMEESAEGEIVEGDDTIMEESSDGEMTEEVIATFPQTVSQGTFYPLVHAVQGTATVYLLEDGSRTLRFEDFEVDNGPDLAVWLVPNETIPNQIGVVPAGYYELAKLTGNQGNQNYAIPADLDLSQFKSVVVWCVTFSVPFAAAPLQSTMIQDDTMIDGEENGMNESGESTTPSEETTMAEPAPSYDPIPLTVELQDLGAAPEITNDTWINADAPVRLADLRGKVVVVEFWTFGCYNCQNVLPYIKEWDAKYEGDNFEVVSVHYPEFTYEREIENVRAAVQEAGIQYPVAIDNEGVTWRAYNQRFWPVWYVVDKQGVIRYKHIGEGGYTETEGVIQALLAE